MSPRSRSRRSVRTPYSQCILTRMPLASFRTAPRGAARKRLRHPSRCNLTRMPLASFRTAPRDAPRKRVRCPSRCILTRIALASFRTAPRSAPRRRVRCLSRCILTTTSAACSENKWSGFAVLPSLRIFGFVRGERPSRPRRVFMRRGDPSEGHESSFGAGRRACGGLSKSGGVSRPGWEGRGLDRATHARSACRGRVAFRSQRGGTGRARHGRPDRIG
jgi:hypothetical protein